MLGFGKISVCLCVYVCMCMKCLFLWVCLCVCLYVYACLHVCICVCVCVKMKRGCQTIASPRMGHTLGENFHACAITKFQKPQQLGLRGSADSVLVDHHVRWSEPSQPQPDLSAAVACKLWLKLLLADQPAKNTWKLIRRVRPLQRGWSARMATRWSSHRPAWSIMYRSLHVSSSANDSFKKFRAPAPVDLTIHTFCTVYRTAGRRSAVVARFGKRWEFGWQSRGL